MRWQIGEARSQYCRNLKTQYKSNKTGWSIQPGCSEWGKRRVNGDSTGVNGAQRHVHPLLIEELRLNSKILSASLEIGVRVTDLTYTASI